MTEKITTKKRDQKWRQIQRICWECKHSFKDGQDMNKWRVNIGHSREKVNKIAKVVIINMYFRQINFFY